MKKFITILIIAFVSMFLVVGPAQAFDQTRYDSNVPADWRPDPKDDAWCFTYRQHISDLEWNIDEIQAFADHQSSMAAEMTDRYIEAANDVTRLTIKTERQALKIKSLRRQLAKS